MIKQIKEWAGVIALVAVIATWVIPSPTGMLAGTTNFDLLDTTDGYAVDGTIVIDGSGNVDAPITTSTLTASATTTLDSSLNLDKADGCINAYATSTDTRINLILSDTTSATSTYAGTVFWDYGACS